MLSSNSSTTQQSGEKPRSCGCSITTSTPLLPTLHVRQDDNVSAIVDQNVPVLVMVHTLWRNGDMYINSPQRVQYLGNNVRVLAPDMLGHGLSPSFQPQSGEQYSIERQALALVNTIVRNVSADTQIILFGYSISGPIVLAASKYLLALQNQYKLRGIVLVAPVLAFQSLDGSCCREESESRRMTRAAAIPSFVRNRMMARTLGSQPLQLAIYVCLLGDRKKHAEYHTTQTNPDAVYGTMQSTFLWCPSDACLAIRQNNVPVLIIDSDNDPLRWNDAKRETLLRLLGPQSNRIVAPKSDHVLMAHATDFVYEKLAQFVDQVSRETNAVF
jgi:pimeloyl-ACP methyl ester carboxylesterase